MAVSIASKRLALDTNVLIDRANGESFAKDFCELFQRRDYSLEIPPTVAAELFHFQQSGNDAERRAAEIALLSMLDWGLTPIVLRDVEKSWKKDFFEMFGVKLVGLALRAGRGHSLLFRSKLDAGVENG